METKDFSLELKEVSDEGVIEGYASVFGNVDQGGDKVMPGAFVEGLAEAKRKGRSIKMLWNHSQYEPIGIWDDLAEDAKGLRAKGRLIMEVAKAKEVFALLKAGAIEGLSIGYQTLKSSPDGNVRQLEKVKLYEISPVTFPMNERAVVSAVKGTVSDDILEKLRAGDRLELREFEAMAKGLGLTNSQAERAARINLKGQGEPAKAATEAREFLTALKG